MTRSTSTIRLSNQHSNAIEYSGEDATIQVGHLEDGSYVADDSLRIPAEKQEIVFEAGHTSKADGIGLGLTFSGELAELCD